jgi:signal transduction protein with GAF and PtsI domain
VVNTGAVMSHAVIVAREFGIPYVVDRRPVVVPCVPDMWSRSTELRSAYRG